MTPRTLSTRNSKKDLATRVRRAVGRPVFLALSLVVALAACEAGITEPSQEPEPRQGPVEPPPPPSTGDIVVVIDSSCQGRIHGAVSFYMDNKYWGQTTDRLTIRGQRRGIHRFEAFTPNRRRQWGPGEFTVRGFPFTLELTCSG